MQWALTNLTNSACPHLGSMGKGAGMHFMNLYEAKIRLSSLVERAAAGEEIIIARNGAARACLVPIAARRAAREPANAMRASRIADDFDAPDPAIARLFAGQDA